MRALLLLACAFLGTPLSPQDSSADLCKQAADSVQRALWITRWDWQGEQGLRQTIARAAQAGFDTVLFQVRGQASVYWDSQIEPWASELGDSPQFDPLAVALQEARAQQVALHAWVNVVPAWWGREPPEDTSHLYHQKPEWFWYDREGKRQELCERFYVSLNPCWPEVREYLARLCAELAGQYALDGLHLDYLRFPNEPPALPAGEARRWPQDARTLKLFRDRTGKSPEADPTAWDQWRADQVTELLRQIRRECKAARPELVLSAALGAERESAAAHHQDWPRWLAEGLLDLAFPMNYTTDPARFESRLEVWQKERAYVSVVMGWMVGNASPALRASQYQLLKNRGERSAAFAYFALWDSPNTILEPQDAAMSQTRAERRALLMPLLKTKSK